VEKNLNYREEFKVQPKNLISYFFSFFGGVKVPKRKKSTEKK